ncbi:MAG: hypothetical protein PHT59_04455, partial [Candidatus Omnitrophica bacterium]|nr:hypothetical protein [Candidatus Omnitrophota bacterium]
MDRKFLMVLLRKNFLLLFLYFANLFIAPSAWSATLNIDQTKVRLSLEPGQAHSGVIEVENPTTSDVIVKAYAEDWVYSLAHDGSKDFYPVGSMPRSASRWISFVPSDFIVPALSKQRVNYTVKVPPDSEGVHVTVLFFESSIGGGVQQGTGMNVMLRIGSLFYIDTAGKTSRQASFDKFAIAQKPKEMTFTVSFEMKNTGTQDITTEGLFHIMDGRGMVYSRGKFNNAYTLPGDIVALSAVSNEPLKPGTYDLVMTFDLGKAQM